MLETTFGYAQLDGGQSFYETAGHGDDLILIHAGFVDSCMWDAQWEAFVQHYRVTRFDLRGFGKSSVADRDMTRREELYRLMNHLNMDQAHLLGCALGGTIALDFTLDHPEHVKSLTLVSTIPSGLETSFESSPKFFQMKDALEQRELGQASELQLQLWVDGLLRLPEDVNSQMRQQVADMNQIAIANKTWLHIDSNPVEPLNPPAHHRFSEIDVPTFIMAGALDNAAVLEAAEALAQGITQAHKRIVADAGHMLNMEKPDAFNQEVLQFLATAR